MFRANIKCVSYLDLQVNIDKPSDLATEYSSVYPNVKAPTKRAKFPRKFLIKITSGQRTVRYCVASNSRDCDFHTVSRTCPNRPPHLHLIFFWYKPNSYMARLNTKSVSFVFGGFYCKPTQNRSYSAKNKFGRFNQAENKCYPESCYYFKIKFSFYL